MLPLFLLNQFAVSKPADTSDKDVVNQSRLICSFCFSVLSPRTTHDHMLPVLLMFYSATSGALAPLVWIDYVSRCWVFSSYLCRPLMRGPPLLDG